MKKSNLTSAQILQTIFSYLLTKTTRRDEIYLVGGAPRDILLGKKLDEITDYDFALKHSHPRRLSGKLSRLIPDSAAVILDDERQICRLIVKPSDSQKDFTFDFSSYRAPRIDKDLLKRDITINAIGINIKDIAHNFISLTPIPETKDIISKIIDPAGGFADIRKKSIRFISETNLREDPVRIIRAFRFSSEIGFSLATKTLTSAKRLRQTITRASYERIRDELLKILDTHNARRTLAYMDRAGIFEILIPEITALKKSCRRFYFHPKGLWHHITETLSALEDYTKNIATNFPESSGELESYLNEKISSGSRRALLKLTALLHDSAKPLCLKRINGRVRFFGHEIMGAQIFQEIGRRLKLSRDEITFGSILVKNHMRILQLVGTNSITERAIYRLKTETGEHFPALCLLSLSDAASYRNLPQFIKKNNIKDVHNFVRREMKKFFDEKKSKPEPRIIDGNIIMRHLGIPQGPIVGEILKRLDEERAMGKIRNTDEALKLAQKIFHKKISKSKNNEVKICRIKNLS